MIPFIECSAGIISWTANCHCKVHYSGNFLAGAKNYKTARSFHCLENWIDEIAKLPMCKSYFFYERVDNKLYENIIDEKFVEYHPATLNTCLSYGLNSQ